MSHNPSLQCLFCQHVNPVDADYCQRCDGQLNLQPCERCDAVDLRTATNCYKCGAKFSLPVAPRLDVPSAPAVVHKEVSYLQPKHPGIVESAAAHLHAGLAFAQPGQQHVYEVLLPHRSATAAPSQRITAGAVLGLLLVAIAAVAVYFYRGHGAQPAPPPSQPQAATPAPSAVAGMGAALKPADTVPTPPAMPNPLERTPAPAPTADAAPTARTNLPVDEKCPPAVATLGLCIPQTPQERP